MQSVLLAAGSSIATVVCVVFAGIYLAYSVNVSPSALAFLRKSFAQVRPTIDPNEKLIHPKLGMNTNKKNFVY
jgi:hypothetical protein